MEGIEGVEVLGRHVGQGAAEHGIAAREGSLCLRHVEVNEQRPAVLAHEHVARLDVTVEHTLPVGMAERVGQPAANEADGVDVIELGEFLPISQL